MGSTNNVRGRFSLDGVSVRYGDHLALAQMDLEIAAGELVAFIGPSGAGKTTLLRLLNGTVRPTSGWVRADGVTLQSLGTKGLRQFRSRVGFIHQDLALVPNLSVCQNVVAGALGRLSVLQSLRAMIWPRTDDVLQVYHLLQRVGIEEKLYQRTDRLSGGQQQRVAMARALHQQPSVILADEPVSSVDPARARAAIETFTSLAREDGLTLIMSLHDVELATEFFPRLIGLRGGKVVLDGSPAEISRGQLEQLYSLSSSEMLADGA